MNEENKRLGYVKLYRSIQNHFGNANYIQFLVFCLVEASHTERDKVTKHGVVHLMPGEFTFGREEVAQRLGMTVRKLRTVLKYSESTGFLTSKTTNRGTIISIVKWDDYQGDEGDKRPAERPTNDQQTTTNKNGRMEECKKRAPATPLTEEDTLSDESVQYALDHGMPDGVIDSEFLKYRDYHIKHDNRYRNWKAAWRTWVRNWAKFNSLKEVK